MTAATSATVRVMSPEEIASRAGGETAYLRWPEARSVFAERAMRLTQLAKSHAMGDYLAFVSAIARAQQQALDGLATRPLPLPEAAAVDDAALRGLPPLAALDWPRDPVWHELLRTMCEALRPSAPAGVQPVLARIAAADDTWLERQADAMLAGTSTGLDLAAAPLVGATLQVVWTHLLLALKARQDAQGAGPTTALARLDDATICPGCGSRPVASITRSTGESLGQRYLHCSLCSLEWHLVRIKCAHCLSDKSLAFQSLDVDDGSGEVDADGKSAGSARAAKAVVQAEACDDCGHYLKIVHTDRDPFVEPVADDLATLTLDLLVSETGKQRHGVNLMLVFGEPDPAPDPGGG